MKAEVKDNVNYSATVFRIRNLVKLDGLDNLVGIPVLGHQALVSKDHEVDQLVVAFTAETQLSEAFAKKNNLHRDATLNDDAEATGYLEANRRIRAIKLRGHRSDALIMPLSSLEFTGAKPEDFKDGDTFDHINGVEICRKYIVPVKENPRAKKDGKEKVNKFEIVDSIFAPEHISTSSFFRTDGGIRPDDFVTVTVKYHGTSVRIFNTITNRKLSLFERVVKKLGASVRDTEYAPVYGSRRVIKNDPNSGSSYYKHDVWTEHGKKLDGVIPAGYAVYGEIVGWTADRTPIQPNYTYGYPEGESDLFVYRVSHINPQGVETDLSWSQVEEFCANLGLKTVPLVWSGRARDFDVDFWMDKRYRDEGFLNALPLSDSKTVDEGVVVRKDGLKPVLLKAKSGKFLAYETKQLDAGNVDLESSEV